MKFLLFVMCIGAAVYFFCFRNSSDTSPAPKAAAAAPKTAAPEPAKAPEKSKEESQAAAVKAKFSADAKYKKDSLGARLAEFHNAPEFLFDPSRKIKIPRTPVNVIRQELKRYPQALKNARDLQKYADLGVEEVYIFSGLKHVGTVQTAVRVLACSGIVNASERNNKQAVEDFNAAGKILNVFLAGSHCFPEMFICKFYTQVLCNAVNHSRLPAKSKQAILRKLPQKKDWAAAFPRLVECDKNFSLQAKTFIDAGGEMKLLGIDAAKLELLKQVSRAHWEEVLNKSQEFILNEWKKGTLSKDTKINVGTEQENILLQETFVVQGYIRFLK